MMKKPDPKTLLQLFTEDHPDLLAETFCECHGLQICPTAWMNRKEQMTVTEEGTSD